MNIRLNVAAVIVRDDRILLVEFDEENGLHYNLPGGGVEVGESVYEALRREVLEECHAEVDTIGAMLTAWEYIGAKEDGKYGEGHKVALAFPCTLKAGSEPNFPSNPDAHQTGIRWVALDQLHWVNLVPDIAARLVPRIKDGGTNPIHVWRDL